MIKVNFINPKKLLIGTLVSVGFYVTNVYADNVVSCDTANGATENTAITATTTHLTDNHDGTISDSKTGLIWKKCAEGKAWNTLGIESCQNSTQESFTWQAALQRAQDVNSGIGQNLSKTNWRLPNIKELASIAELRCNDPAINNTVFPQTAASFYWSSSLYAAISVGAWDINFLNGKNHLDGKGNVKHVRLVRSGQ